MSKLSSTPRRSQPCQVRIAAAAQPRRLVRALSFIADNPQRAFTIEELSTAVGGSKFHLHRQLSSFLGESVASFLRRQRLRRAAMQLVFRDWQSILDIALASGYESHEAFGRAFKRLSGQTPSAFRRQPRLESWHRVCASDGDRARTMGSALEQPAEHRVCIVEFPKTPIAVLEHHGHPVGLPDTIRRFIAWRRENDVRPPASATFNLFYGDPLRGEPQGTPDEAFRLDLCAATEKTIAANALGVYGSVIPQGRCAALRYRGYDAGLSAAFEFLYGEWLPQSGEELRDFPLFVRRLHTYPDVAEHEAEVDIYLPLL